VEVRPARPDEYEEAGRVTALAYREFVEPGETAWEAYLQEIADVRSRATRGEVLVAVEGSRIVGSATLELVQRIDGDDPPLAPDEAHVRMLGVDPGARRLGAARALMEACVDRAVEAGRTRMTLHTTHRMTTAQAMYERFGFERLADRVFPDGFVLLTYQKRIAPGEDARPG
jgi:ribosomal protein S18 acetylase RimI-like enzyme